MSVEVSAGGLHPPLLAAASQTDYSATHCQLEGHLGGVTLAWVLGQQVKAQGIVMPGQYGNDWSLLTPLSHIFSLCISSPSTSHLSISLSLSPVVLLPTCLGPIPWASHINPFPLPSLTLGGGMRSDPFLQNPLPLPPDISVFNRSSSRLSSCLTDKMSNPDYVPPQVPSSCLHLSLAE